MMLSNIVILSGLVPYSDLSCTKRKCISRKFVTISCKLKCLNVIMNNLTVFYRTVASCFQRYWMQVTMCVFSSLQNETCACVCVCVTQMCIYSYIRWMFLCIFQLSYWWKMSWKGIVVINRMENWGTKGSGVHINIQLIII